MLVLLYQLILPSDEELASSVIMMICNKYTLNLAKALVQMPRSLQHNLVLVLCLVWGYREG